MAGLSVKDSLHLLLSAGPLSSRPAPPSTGSSADLEADFPALRPHVWRSISEALSSAHVQNKYVRKLVEEAVYGLQVAQQVVVGAGIASTPLFSHLHAWAWTLAALCARLAANALVDLDSSSELLLPAVLSKSHTAASSASDAGVADHGEADDDVTGADGEDGSGAGGVRGRATVGRLEDAVLLAHAALDFALARDGAVLAHLRHAAAGAVEAADSASDAGSSGSDSDSDGMADTVPAASGSSSRDSLSSSGLSGCPLLALCTATVRLVASAAKAQSNARKVQAALLQPVRNKATGSDAPHSLLVLLLQLRDTVVAEVEDSRAAAALDGVVSSADGVLHAQRSALLADVEDLLLSCLFPTEALPNYPAATVAASALVQHATLQYAAVRDADNGSGAAAPSSRASGGAGGVAASPASSSVPAARDAADTGQSKGGKGAKANAATASSSSSKSTPAKGDTAQLYVAPVVANEARVFAALSGEPAAAAAAAEKDREKAGGGGHGALRHSYSFEPQPAVLRALPFIFGAYLRCLRSQAADRQSGSTADAAASGIASAGAQAGKKRGREEGDATATATGLAPPAAMAAVAALNKQHEFGMAVELLALAMGYHVPTSVPVKGVAALAPLVSVPVAGLSTTRQRDLMYVRLRAVAALLTLVCEAGVYNVHEDVSPHPQTAVLAAVQRWALHCLAAVQQEAQRSLKEVVAVAQSGEKSWSPSTSSDTRSLVRVLAAACSVVTVVTELNHTTLHSAAVGEAGAASADAGLATLLTQVLQTANTLIAVASAEDDTLSRLRKSEEALDKDEDEDDEDGDDDEEDHDDSGDAEPLPLQYVHARNVLRGACVTLVNHLLLTFSKLRQVDVLLAAVTDVVITQLARSNADVNKHIHRYAFTAGDLAPFLHSVLSSDAVLSVVASTWALLPPGQVEDLAAALHKLTEAAADATAAATVQALAALEERHDLEEELSNGEEDDDMPDADEHDADVDRLYAAYINSMRRMQDAVDAALLTEATAAWYASFLRSLQITPATATRHLNKSLRAAYRVSALLLRTGGQLYGKSQGAAYCTMMRTGLELLSAATDCALVCARFDSVRAIVPTVFTSPAASTAAAAAAAAQPQALQIMWPLSVLYPAAPDIGTDVAAAGDTAEAAIAGKLSSGGSSLSKMAAALASGSGAASAATLRSARAPTISLPNVQDTCSVFLMKKKAAPKLESEPVIHSAYLPLLAARESALSFAHARLRLLHTYICTAASSESAELRSAAKSLSNMVLRASGTTAAACMDVAPLYAGEEQLATFVKDVMDPVADMVPPGATRSAGSSKGPGEELVHLPSVQQPWRNRVLADPDVYHLPAIVTHMSAGIAAHVREGMRGLLDCFTKQVVPQSTPGSADKRSAKHSGGSAASATHAEQQAACCVLPSFVSEEVLSLIAGVEAHEKVDGRPPAVHARGLLTTVELPSTAPRTLIKTPHAALTALAPLHKLEGALRHVLAVPSSVLQVPLRAAKGSGSAAGLSQLLLAADVLAQHLHCPPQPAAADALEELDADSLVELRKQVDAYRRTARAAFAHVLSLQAGEGAASASYVRELLTCLQESAAAAAAASTPGSASKSKKHVETAPSDADTTGLLLRWLSAAAGSGAGDDTAATAAAITSVISSVAADILTRAVSAAASGSGTGTPLGKTDRKRVRESATGELRALVTSASGDGDSASSRALLVQAAVLEGLYPALRLLQAAGAHATALKAASAAVSAAVEGMLTSMSSGASLPASGGSGSGAGHTEALIATSHAAAAMVRLAALEADADKRTTACTAAMACADSLAAAVLQSPPLPGAVAAASAWLQAVVGALDTAAEHAREATDGAGQEVKEKDKAESTELYEQLYVSLVTLPTLRTAAAVVAAAPNLQPTLTALLRHCRASLLPELAVAVRTELHSQTALSAAYLHMSASLLDVARRAHDAAYFASIPSHLHGVNGSGGGKEDDSSSSSDSDTDSDSSSDSEAEAAAVAQEAGGPLSLSLSHPSAPGSLCAAMASTVTATATTTRDAIITFARTLLPATCALPLSTSHSHALAALAFLRVACAASRLLPLRDAEVGAAVQALQGMYSLATAARLAAAAGGGGASSHTAASPSASSSASAATSRALLLLPVERIDVDVGARYCGDEAATAGDADWIHYALPEEDESAADDTSVAVAVGVERAIVTNAAWFAAHAHTAATPAAATAAEAPTVLPASAVATAPAAPMATASGPVFEAACGVLHVLLKYRRDWALSSMAAVVGVTRSLFAIALSPAASSDASADGYLQPRYLVPLCRVCEQLSRTVRMARYHAVHLLVTYLQLAAGTGTGAAAARKAPPASVRSALSAGVYALLDACGSKEMQMAHTMLAPAPAARAQLKMLHNAYTAEYKYTGKA